MQFTIQIIISFLVGGLTIALQTLFAERVSRKWRGLVLTIPTTLALGLLFIGIAKTSVDAAEATIVVPASIGVTYIFVTVFSLLSRFGITISLLGAFSVWALLGSLLMKYPPANFADSILYMLPQIFVGYILIRKVARDHKLKVYPMSWRQLVIRSIFGGSVIAAVMVLAKYLGNHWGGLFSAFPAGYTSTFIIYFIAQGKQVIPDVGKTLFFPGVIGFVVYSFVAETTFPVSGIWLGTLYCYLAVAVFFWLWYSIRNVI